MSLTPGARRAEAFAALLERPERTDEPSLAPYLALAGALSALPAPTGPSPEFRSALRQRLLAVATVQGVGEPDRSATARIREAGVTWNFQRRMAILAGGAATATAIAGVGVGASRSLPGDPFYGVKRATERVQLATTVGQEAKGKRHLEFARTRLSEVQALVGHDSALPSFLPSTAAAVGPLTDEAKASTIIATLRDMDSETRAGAHDLLAVARNTGSIEPLQALDTFTRDQFDDLRSVLAELPVQAQPRAEQSLALLTTVGARTVATAGTTGSDGGTGNGPGGPGSPATPSRSSQSSSAPSGGGSQQPSGSTTSAPTKTPTTPSVPTQLPTDVPTIVPLPTVTPLPTLDPSTLPSLGDLPLLDK